MLVKLDTLAAVDESKLSNLGKVLPFFLNNPSVRIDGKLYAVPYVWGGVPMMYDPAVATTAPTSWKDVLKPEFAGKVAMLDNLNNIQLAARVVTDAKVPTRLTPEQLAKAVDFLIEVKKQSRVHRRELRRHGRRDGARRSGHHLQWLGGDGQHGAQEGQGDRLHLSEGGHVRLVRLLLHRQGCTELPTWRTRSPTRPSAFRCR